MMRERILAAYDPFVLPFVFGMTFVLCYCLIALVKILFQLSPCSETAPLKETVTGSSCDWTWMLPV